MFAYCGNNPVLCCDSCGHSFVDSTKELQAMGLGGSSGNLSELLLTVLEDACDVVGIGIALSIADTFEERAKEIISVIESAANITSRYDQSVYVMKYNVGEYKDRVGYVGRTNDPKRRQAEHNRDHSKDDLGEIIVIATGLNKTEAIALEQAVISTFTLGNLENRRREIGYWRLGMFSDYSYTLNYIKDLEISFWESEWLCYLGR